MPFMPLPYLYHLETDAWDPSPPAILYVHILNPEFVTNRILCMPCQCFKTISQLCIYGIKLYASSFSGGLDTQEWKKRGMFGEPIKYTCMLSLIPFFN